MQCCRCKKKLEEKDNTIHKSWYGKYDGCKLIRAICSDCIKKPENKDWWK